MATPCIESTDGFYFGRTSGSNVTNIQSVMPLLANLTFRNGRFLVSDGSLTLTALKSLFEEISKIIP